MRMSQESGNDPGGVLLDLRMRLHRSAPKFDIQTHPDMPRFARDTSYPRRHHLMPVPAELPQRRADGWSCR